MFGFVERCTDGGRLCIGIAGSHRAFQSGCVLVASLQTSPEMSLDIGYRSIATRRGVWGKGDGGEGGWKNVARQRAATRQHAVHSPHTRALSYAFAVLVRRRNLQPKRQTSTSFRYWLIGMPYPIVSPRRYKPIRSTKPKALGSFRSWPIDAAFERFRMVHDTTQRHATPVLLTGGWSKTSRGRLRVLG